MSSVGEDYPVQQARCCELLDQYKSMRGTPGANVEFAIANVTEILRVAEYAAASGDPVKIVRAYAVMKSCE